MRIMAVRAANRPAASSSSPSSASAFAPCLEPTTGRRSASACGRDEALRAWEGDAVRGQPSRPSRTVGGLLGGSFSRGGHGSVGQPRSRPYPRAPSRPSRTVGGLLARLPGGFGCEVTSRRLPGSYSQRRLAAGVGESLAIRRQRTDAHRKAKDDPNDADCDPAGRRRRVPRAPRPKQTSQTYAGPRGARSRTPGRDPRQSTPRRRYSRLGRPERGGPRPGHRPAGSSCRSPAARPPR